jgi:hypothetical protein
VFSNINHQHICGVAGGGSGGGGGGGGGDGGGCGGGGGDGGGGVLYTNRTPVPDAFQVQFSPICVNTAKKSNQCNSDLIKQPFEE